MRKKEKFRVGTVEKSIIDKEILREKKMSDGIDILNKYREKSEKERSERIGKTLNEVIEERKMLAGEEEQNKFSKKAKTYFIAIFTVILICIVYTFFEYGPILGVSLVSDDSVNEEQKIEFVSSDNDIYTEYNKELLIYSNQTVTTYNSSAQKTWEYEISDKFIPQIYTNGRFMVICNNTNGIIYLFENKEQILTNKIDGTIQKIYLDSKGNMAVEYSSTGYKKIVGVYTKNGKNLYNAYLSSNALVGVKLINNASKMIILQSNSSSFKIGVDVLLIDSTEQNVQTKEILKLDDSYVFDIAVQGQNIILVLDSGIIKLNMVTKDKKEIKNFDTSQVMFIALEDNHYTYIEKSLDSYIIQTNRFDNSIVGNYDIGNCPNMMKSSKMLSYLVYQDNLQIINEWGLEVKKISISSTPKNIVIFGNQKSIALIYTNKVYIVNI